MCISLHVEAVKNLLEVSRQFVDFVCIWLVEILPQMGLHMQGDTGFLRRLLEARETNHPMPSGNHDRDVLDVALHKLHSFLFCQ